MLGRPVRGVLPGPELGSLDAAVIGTITVLAVLIALSLATAPFRAFLPRADLIEDTLSAIGASTVAVLAWAQFRERSDPIRLFIASAVLVLAVDNAATLVQLQLGNDGDVLAEQVVQAQELVSAVVQFMVAGLLIAGATVTLTGRELSFPTMVLFGPAVALIAAELLVRLAGPNLPGLETLSGGPTATPGRDPLAGVLFVATALGTLVHLATAALFVLAGTLARRLYRSRKRLGDASLAVACVFAAFAEANAAIHPGVSLGYIRDVDVLRLGFLVALLGGLAAEARSALHYLQQTNATLEHTRHDDFARAGQEERSRLSREFHDGLAQDLWLAKLKVGRLLSMHDAGPEAIALSRELGAAIDAGLADARHAVMALRLPESGSFSDLLGRYVDDFSDAFGVSTVFSCDETLPVLQPLVQAELMRIAQESLNNVRRHADASLVQVSVRIEGDHLRMAVIDNGRGFDLTDARRGAFGLVGMRERATLIGGALQIQSSLRGGTSVLVDLPMLATAVSPAVGES